MIQIREMATFKIPPKLLPYMKIAGDLKNLKNWKAKIFIGNSITHDQKKDDILDSS